MVSFYLAYFLKGFFIVTLLALLLLSINLYSMLKSIDTQKVSSYECGFEPINDARNIVSIHFYIVSILFLIFDLEILLLYPLIYAYYNLSIIGFFSIILFVFILGLCLIIELFLNALEWVLKDLN